MKGNSRPPEQEPGHLLCSQCSIHKFINNLTDTVVDTAAKCASLSQAQGVKQLLPVINQGVNALLPGAQHHQLATNNFAIDTSMTNCEA